MLLTSVKDAPCPSVLCHNGSLDSHGLNIHLFLYSLHAPFLHQSESCLCVSCNILVLSSFSHAEVSCFSINEALCVSSSLSCPHSSSFLSYIRSLACSFFFPWGNLFWVSAFLNCTGSQCCKDMEERGRSLVLVKMVNHPLALWSIGSSPQIWVAVTAPPANQLQDVNHKACVYMYLLPFIFLFSPKSVWHCRWLEHTLKCWNLSNNPVSWNYLVIDKQMKKYHLANNHNIQGWKLPYYTRRSSVPQCSCFSQATLNICRFSYKGVLQADLMPFGRRSRLGPALRLSLPLCWFLATLCQLCVSFCGLWVTRFSPQRVSMTLCVVTPSDSYHPICASFFLLQNLMDLFSFSFSPG